MNLNSVSFMHTINSCLSFVASFKSMHTVEEEREGAGFPAYCRGRKGGGGVPCIL